MKKQRKISSIVPMQKYLRVPCFGKFIQQDSSPPENPLYRWDEDLLPTFSPFKKSRILLKQTNTNQRQPFQLQHRAFQMPLMPPWCCCCWLEGGGFVFAVAVWVIVVRCGGCCMLYGC